MKRRSPVVRAGVIDRLETLSRNLWWSWSADGPALWEAVARHLSPTRARGAVARGPVWILAALTARQRQSVATDPEIATLLVRVEKAWRRASRGGTSPCAVSSRAPVAYFSMEFGLHESLPVYAGGLGILAGDHLKSASDTRLPLVGVGLFYHRGYFRQDLDRAGRQGVRYPRSDPSALAMEPVLEPGGRRELRVSVELESRTVKVRAFLVRVGRVALYLLDTDFAGNRPADRRITHRLYGGTREDRIRQEVVCGVGGVRLLRALGVRPGVWHLNEGHVVFLALERLRELRGSTDLSPAEAMEVVASDTVFTTHTPVPEGNEVFDLALADRYLRPLADAAGIPVETILSQGLDQDGSGNRFLSLTVLALRLSRFRNGVSRLHGEVSRAMWAKLWPGLRTEEVPIGSVTNGIHTQSWMAPRMDTILRDQLDGDWTERLADPDWWREARRLPDRALWTAKQELKTELVEFVRSRVRERMGRQGASASRIEKEVAGLLDPEALTIGFARRFALYKRADLLFRDLKRAETLFGSSRRPVQIIYAGKPHPEDAEGARLFERIAKLSRRPALRGRVVLLENYDIEVARHMVQGVDVWLNNPRRPLEASGTSGEKVPPNAGVNVSILDGWWCEGYAPDTGFAFGQPRDYVDHERQDRDDCAALHRVLRQEVLPLYWTRNRSGVPTGWLRLVKSSMARLVPEFSTERMVLEYARTLYEPALENGRRVTGKRYALARELAEWTESVRRAWPLVHVREVRAATRSSKARGGSRAGSRARARSAEVEVVVYLAGLDPDRLGCVSASGDLVPIVAATAGSDGTWTLRIAVSEGGEHRLLPMHPEQVHLQELGCSLTFRAGDGMS